MRTQICIVCLIEKPTCRFRRVVKTGRFYKKCNECIDSYFEKKRQGNEKYRAPESPEKIRAREMSNNLHGFIAGLRSAKDAYARIS